MEQSFVHTESHDDAPVLRKPSKRGRPAPKAATVNRKLKPGLY
ncbi:hypothetical protein SAMN06295910_0939 [Allosphingosinicella indica]|uniref:Uncharacterized protein n=1 Tax=Allosphingosinicella indica TaxID=941907 RepID=A0A1X7G0X4_9SPHN|nr:hypothetical protein SAMN06295910_0939 [Allosphingosinicella indica]